MFESAIDLLSDMTLNQLHITQRGDVHRLIQSGTSPLALLQYLVDHPQIGKIYACMDVDQAGRNANKKLERLLISRDLTSMDIDKYGYLLEQLVNRSFELYFSPPPMGKDYNDSWQWYREKMKERRYAR